MIQIVDVEANDFVTEHIVLKEPVQGSRVDFESLFRKNRLRALELLEQYRIVEGNTGALLYEHSSYKREADHPYDPAVRSVEISLPDGAGRFSAVRIELEETAASSSKCPQLKQSGLEPKIFTLRATAGGESQLLQEDRVLYASRRCPYRYGIYRIYALERSLAVFLHSWTTGVVEDDVLKLVVTGNITVGEKAEQALSVTGRISLGSTHQEVKSLLPELGPLKRDAGPGLTETLWSGTAFGLPATGEFNFKDGALYSYYFFLRDLDAHRSLVLYERLNIE